MWQQASMKCNVRRVGDVSQLRWSAIRDVGVDVVWLQCVSVCDVSLLSSGFKVLRCAAICNAL